jgi:hypothetical protein
MKMKGVSVSRINGEVVFVNVVDGCGNGPIPYPVDEYVRNGYQPDYRTLPDEGAVR